ncbi:hypothetical protein ACWD4N_43900, partial [Streptomyces sp. NPDC002586]
MQKEPGQTGAELTERLLLAIGQPLLNRDARNAAVRAYTALEPAHLRLAAAERRYDDSMDPSGLQEAVWVFDDLISDPLWEEMPAIRRSTCQNRVSRILQELYQLDGENSTLRRAIALSREAVAAARLALELLGDPEDTLHGFGDMVAESGGPPPTVLSPESADEAAKTRRQVAAILPDAEQALGEQLSTAFDHDQDQSVIDEAVTVLRDAANRADALDRNQQLRLEVTLSGALLLRFKVFGDHEDAVAMVAAAERAVGIESSPKALDALGCCLLARAELPGHEDDVDDAVRVLDDAVQADPANPWLMTNLGVALNARFARSGRIHDGERALATLDAAASAVPQQAPDRARIEQNRQSVRYRLGERLHDRPLSDRPTVDDGLPAADSVAAARELLSRTPAGARSRPARLGALAHSLIRRFERGLHLPDLEEA